MEVGIHYLTKPQYYYKQASISFFVNHGLQMLTSSVLMTLFESLGHVWDPRYLKELFWHFSVAPDYPNILFWYFAIGAKVGGWRDPISRS